MFGKRTPLAFTAIINICCIFLLGQGCVEYVSEPLPPQGDSSSKLMIIVHGVNSSPDSWPLELQNAIDARLSPETRQSWDIVRYGWEEYADTPWGASTAGPELGKQVGTMLSGEDYDYDQIHFIAHGAGSFVAHGAATTYTAGATQPAAIHTTYLDPVSSAAVSAGHGAVFSDNYFNTNDSVSSSNTAIASSHNFDVTNFILRDVGTDEGHIWPVNFYIQTVEDDRLLYGFQLSPMTNTPPVDFTQFPVSQTTTLYDEVPTETVILSTGPMDLPTTGTFTAYMNYDLQLTVGASTHPMAQNLRDIGVDGTSPIMVTLSTDYQSLVTIHKVI